MPADIFNEFWEAITTIEAQKMLTEMTVADYPHAKKEERSKIHRHLYSLAYPSLFKDEKVHKITEVASLFGKVVNGR